MYKYEIVIYWSDEDEAFIAEVPEFPGCMAHGDNQQVALSRVCDAIKLWLNTAREHGDAIPEPIKANDSCMRENILRYRC